VGNEAPAGGREGARQAFVPRKAVVAVLDKGGWRVTYSFEVPGKPAEEKPDDSEF
jgi:hypothetical protein